MALITLRCTLILQNSSSDVLEFMPTRTFWSKLVCDIPKFEVNMIFFVFLLFEQKFERFEAIVVLNFLSGKLDVTLFAVDLKR